MGGRGFSPSIRLFASVGGASGAREPLTSDCERRGVVFRLRRRELKNLGLSVCHLPIERLNRPSRASFKLGAENRTGFEARRRRQARSATPSRPSAERGGLDGVRRRLPDTSAPMVICAAGRSPVAGLTHHRRLSPSPPHSRSFLRRRPELALNDTRAPLTVWRRRLDGCSALRLV